MLRIRNISLFGLMAETDAEFTPGELLAIELPGVGEITATLRWAARGRIGVRFDAALKQLPLRGRPSLPQRATEEAAAEPHRLFGRKS